MIDRLDVVRDLAERLGSHFAAALLQDLSDAAVVADETLQIVYLNPAGERVFGYRQSAIIGLPVTLLVPARLRHALEERFRRFQQTGDPEPIRGPWEITGRRSNGEEFPMEISVTVCYGAEETYYIAILRDRSRERALQAELESHARELQSRNEELSQARDLLRRQAAQLEQVFATMTEGVLVVDSEGRLQQVNQAGRQLLGPLVALNEPLASANWRAPNGQPFPPELLPTSRALRTGHSIRNVPVTLQRGRHARREISVSAAPLRDAAGNVTGAVAVLHDVTVQNRLTRARERAAARLTRSNEQLRRRTEELESALRTLAETRAQLEQTERLASLGHLTAGIAHEINNPLAFVSNNVAILERDWAVLMEILEHYRQSLPALEQADPARAAEIRRLEHYIDLEYVAANLHRVFASTREGLRRVRDIIQSLRDFARMDDPDFQAVNLNTCLEQALEMVSFRFERRQIQVRREYGELPPVAGHPGKLHQVFLNLLINAMEAIQAANRAPGVIRLRTEAAAGGARVEIHDNGCGIPPEALPRLFNPFFTTKGPGEGTGLGLSISYGIVKAHGGTIEAEPLPEGGACFRLWFPALPATQN